MQSSLSLAIYKICLVFVVGCVACHAASAATFLILDRWGGVIGASRTAAGELREPEVVRPWMESPEPVLFIDMEADVDGGYQLTQTGVLLPMGSAPPLQFAPSPAFNATALAMLPGGAGGWIAVDDYIKRIGRQPELVFPRELNQGRRLADLEYDRVNRRLAVLFEDGGLVVCSQQALVEYSAIKLKNDKALDIEIDGEEFLVLTKNANVVRLKKQSSALDADAPILTTKNAVDLEMSPFGEGYYVLDAFGVIHACGGAPKIETEALARADAVDLEWISTDKPPRWYPTGWNTQVALQPHSLRLDPEGSSKYLSLMIDGAENMRRFVVELRLDPTRLVVDPNGVLIGPWWNRNINTPNLKASYDESKGLLTLHGTGSATIVGGANGGGEAALVPIAPAPGVQAATASVAIEQFFFEDAALSYPYRLNAEPAPSIIQFQSMAPIINLEWSMQSPPMAKAPATGSVIRADVYVQHGGRIQALVFDMKFTHQTLRLLGMTPGDAWEPRVPLRVQFATPSLANPNGEINNQEIRALGSGACKDERGSMLTLFFAVQEPGAASVQFKKLMALDEKDRELNAVIEANSLNWTLPASEQAPRP